MSCVEFVARIPFVAFTCIDTIVTIQGHCGAGLSEEANPDDQTQTMIFLLVKTDIDRGEFLE